MADAKEIFSLFLYFGTTIKINLTHRHTKAINRPPK